MEKERLLELLKSEPSKVDAIGMILSNYTDYSHSEMGGMVSVKRFRIVAEVILEWFDTETIDPLESRIKELEEEKTTELIIEKEDYYGCLTNITKTKCCGIAPITNENFCPNCGRKIIRK